MDVLHRRKLDELLDVYGLKLTEEETDHFNRLWHRLLPWPDVQEGLRRLKTKYSIGPFSNGGFPPASQHGKGLGAALDFILAGQQFQKFEPDPTIYEDAVELLGGRPEEVLMVAASSDLDGAHASMPDSLCARPLEYGAVNNHGAGSEIRPRNSGGFPGSWRRAWAYKEGKAW